jgi:hypothetical protein
MSTYTSEVFPSTVAHPDVKYLHDQIDFNQFLPIEGEYEWCRDYSNLKFPGLADNLHPSPAQHKAFTEGVIIPFLQDKKYI